MSEKSVEIYKGETLDPRSGESLFNVELEDNGNYTMFVHDEGRACDVYVGKANELLVERGGEVQRLRLFGCDTARVDGGTVQQAEVVDCTLMIFNEANATDIAIGKGGIFRGSNNSIISNINVQEGGYSYIINCTLKNIDIESDAKLDFSDGTLSDVVLENGASLCLTNATLTNLTIKGDFKIAFFRQNVIQGNLVVEGETESLGGLDLSQCELTFALKEDAADTPFIRDWTSLTITPKTLSVRAADAMPSNDYALADNAGGFATEVQLQNPNGDVLGIVSQTAPLELDEVRFVLNNDGQTASLTVSNRQMLRISASGAQLDIASGWWDSTVLSTIYKQTASVDVTTRDLHCEGEFRRAATAEVDITPTARIQAKADGTADIFLAEAIGKWGKAFRAQNSFTGQYALLEGKNRFANVFCGADNDAAVLTLTGEDDAIFADDIYTAFEGKRENRLQKLDAICAGDGDDIIDLTCINVASEDSDSLALYGNDGNDILWGGTQAILIVGGEGNDNMSSQRDGVVFAFDAAWGQDIIHVSSELDFRLWFEEGTEIDVSYDDFGAKVTSGNSNVVLAGIFSGIEDKILIGAADGIQYGGYAYGTLASAF